MAQEAEPGGVKLETQMGACRAESSGRSGAGVERRWTPEDGVVDSLRARLCSRRCQARLGFWAQTLSDFWRGIG